MPYFLGGLGFGGGALRFPLQWKQSLLPLASSVVLSQHQVGVVSVPDTAQRAAQQRTCQQCSKPYESRITQVPLDPKTRKHEGFKPKRYGL